MMTKRSTWLSPNVEEPIDPDLQICDSHHHLWDRPDCRYLLDELMKDIGAGHRISRTVFVECRSRYKDDGPEELRPVGETGFVQSIADQTASERATLVANGIVGHADLTLGGRVAAVLEAHLDASKNRFRGIRYVTAWHSSPEVAAATRIAPEGLLLDSKFREGFACLQKYNLCFDAWLYFPQLMELAGLARAFPDTPIVVNHIGGLIGVGPYAGKRDEVLGEWRRRMKALAACDNVFVKLGGFGMPRCGFGWSERSTPPSSAEVARAIAPYCHWCIDQFGVDRSMFESNFPVDRRSYSYSVVWNAYKRVTREYSSEERDSLFRNTAMRFYRLSAQVD